MKMKRFNAKAVLYAGFEWRTRYSNDDNADHRGRWARLLFYKGLLVCWVNRVDHITLGRFYSVNDYFPTSGNDNPLRHETAKDKTFEQIKKEAEDRFLTFIKSCI